MTRVLLVNASGIVSMGLQQMVASREDLELTVIGRLDHDAVATLGQYEMDIVLFDLCCSDLEHTVLLRCVIEASAGVPVLALSFSAEKDLGVSIIRAGAAGFLRATSAPEQILYAITKVAGGGRYVSPALAESLADAMGHEQQLRPHERLSNRELQIFDLLIAGKRILDIAETLSISSKTVSAHRANILGKMGLKNNAELIYYAIRHHLIPLDRPVPMEVVAE